MEFAKDCELEEKIRGMVSRLLDPEPAVTINFRFIRYRDPDFPFNMKVWFDGPSRHLIVINVTARQMLSTETGEEIVYAALAHEIGHILDMRNNGLTGFYALCLSSQVPGFLRKRLSPLAPHLQFFTGFWARAECRADNYGVELLARVFPDPIEIMSRQVRFALKNSMDRNRSSRYSRFQARVFAWVRLRNLGRLARLFCVDKRDDSDCTLRAMG